VVGKAAAEVEATVKALANHGLVSGVYRSAIPAM
jgi:hypothetical protein